MSMTLPQAKKALLLNTRAGNASLLRSPSGYGKSTIAMEAFRDFRGMNARKGLTTGLGIVFLATQTPPDLVGYQFKGDKTFRLPAPVTMPDGNVVESVTVTVTDPSAPLWYQDVFTGKPASMFDKFVVILEEYGQGEPDTKRAAAELLLNGGIAPWKLPEGSARWALTNSGTRYGVTKDFLFAIARRTLIDIAQDIDVLVDHWDKPYRYQGRDWQPSAVWKAWARTGGSAVVFEPEPKEDGPWCNPRTMMAADRIYQCMVDDNDGRDIDPNDNILLDMFAGTIGMPATQSCVQHLQFRTQLPSYDDVVADPSGAPLPAKGDLQMLMAYEMANQTKVDSLAEALTYVSRLPKDMGITYISALLRRDYKGMLGQPAMQAWVQKNSTVVAIVASLAAN